MKNLICIILTFISLSVYSQRYDNYKPDNKTVELTETNLPIVFINTKGKMIDRDLRIDADMSIIYNGENKLNYKDTIKYKDQNFDYKGKIGLRYRGNSSFNASDRKPYSIKTQKDNGKKLSVSLLGIGADSDWVLLAPYSDKSMIRDVLIYTLSKENFEYTPELKFCELILDDVYYGVFMLGSRIRAGKNRIDIEEPGFSGDNLTGGYMVEVDRNDEEHYYTSIFYSTTSSGELKDQRTFFQYKYPEYQDMTPTQLSYLHNSITTFEASFSGSYYTDPVKGYRKYADIQSFINYMISTEFTRNTDGYRLSTPLYK